MAYLLHKQGLFLVEEGVLIIYHEFKDRANTDHEVMIKNEIERVLRQEAEPLSQHLSHVFAVMQKKMDKIMGGISLDDAQDIGLIDDFFD